MTHLLATSTIPTANSDRNFDDIADHFANKVYGGQKGRIRLAVLERDINEVLASLTHLDRPLNILDVGAGLAQISLQLAKTHHCTITDISSNMLAKARANADELGIKDNTRFITASYQELGDIIKGNTYDVILCHAVLEWLGEPKAIMDFFDEFLASDGVLSLCFYNPASPIYRNLVMGNFYQLTTPKTADNKSLTPNHPVSLDEVSSWLNERHYRVLLHSGIRVFSDYAPLKRGGLNNADDVVAMELKYARQLPFRLMGRYLHVMATKSTELIQL
ncbi:MAG: methyltransferase domain-containing protein [Moraxella sp.]|nr:methyltransferase domain-containing protein [Moraxella sp.]